MMSYLWHCLTGAVLELISYSLKVWGGEDGEDGADRHTVYSAYSRQQVPYTRQTNYFTRGFTAKRHLNGRRTE